ncbi:MAG TPA: dihydrodipicolinate synthase family protein [Stellaceae bacterium]|nr:dihydrodipicolinate synthase family protein [Stellaceae bacterium]
MATITLPGPDRSLRRYATQPPRAFPARAAEPFNRVALAAAHVVADPLASADPWIETRLDWDATIAYRRHLWALGFGVAEAMDTAQRGAGLEWSSALELIRHSLDAAKDVPGALLYCGAGTDHLGAGAHRLDQVISAYEKQVAAIEELGGRIVLMASRALAAAARGPGDYAKVYDRILGQVKNKVILHWLGDMFDPALAGYWGHKDLDAASDVMLDIVKRHRTKIDGVKISLLDKQREVALRWLLPEGVRMYTGDDFNYAELIAGDGERHSDALLGIFDAIAPAASAALAALAHDEPKRFHDILAPTVPLARHIFRAPTRFYKTGVVFMAYLNGHQRHFTMVAGQESARSLLHLVEIFQLADAAGLLADPDLACARMATVLRLHGVEP